MVNIEYIKYKITFAASSKIPLQIHVFPPEILGKHGLISALRDTESWASVPA